MGEQNIVVVVWYRANEYAAVRALAADADRMEKTFQEWKVFADETVRSHEAAGRTVWKVHFDNTAFMRWASARNVQSTDQSRIDRCSQKVGRSSEPPF